MPIPQERDMGAISSSLADWLNSHEGIEDAQISNIEIPSASGFSNETLLADLKYKFEGESKEHGIVIRKKPSGGYAIFPEYNMALQYKCMQAVGKNSNVPVPEILWTDDTGDILGDPFFVMSRLYGKVPSDNPPFYGEGFVKDATPKQQKTLWTSSLQTLAEIAKIDWKRAGFEEFLGQKSFRDQLDYYKKYLEWAAEGRPQPTLEAALEYFYENDPSGDMETQLTWGDARPSNMMYGDDFKPIGVFDWEMAALGPAEIDFGWFLAMNRWQCHAANAEWLPGFSKREESIAIYEKALGRKVEHLDYFEAFGYFRFCVITIKIIAMQIAFGVMEEEVRAFERANPAVEMLAETLGMSKPEL